MPESREQTGGPSAPPAAAILDPLSGAETDGVCGAEDRWVIPPLAVILIMTQRDGSTCDITAEPGWVTTNSWQPPHQRSNQKRRTLDGRRPRHPHAARLHGGKVAAEYDSEQIPQRAASTLGMPPDRTHQGNPRRRERARRSETFTADVCLQPLLP